MELGVKYKGIIGSITVFENRIEISDRKLTSINNEYGTKIIFIKNISAIQFVEPKFLSNGAIQFIFEGSNEKSHAGLFSRIIDENTVLFDKNNIEVFKEIKDFIISKK